jgi:hypothetical protein
MIGLLCFVLAVLASPFKSKLRLARGVFFAKIEWALSLAGGSSDVKKRSVVAVEKRRLQRTTIKHPGRLFLHQKTVHDCIVHNVTGLGACLELLSAIQEFPEAADFSFDNFRTIHRCRIIWRGRRPCRNLFRRLTQNTDG